VKTTAVGKGWEREEKRGREESKRKQPFHFSFFICSSNKKLE